ncbi:S1C family serine protease [Microbacterium sp. GXF7504]
MTDTEGTVPEQPASSSSDTPVTPASQEPASAPTTAGAAAPQPQAPQQPVGPAFQAGVIPPRPPLPQTAARPVYPGAPSGHAFGPAAQHPHFAATGPTQPIGPAPVAPAPATPARRSGAGRLVGLLVAAAVVGGAAGLGGAYAGEVLWGDEQTTTATGGTAVTVNDTDSVTQTTAVAAKVVPTVVTIAASGNGSGGSGSGVILSEDGYVLTNTHVVTLDGTVADPDLQVTTSDGRIFDATVVGTDPMYDLAVIKLVGASDLPVAEWGDSNSLNVGDQTIAVGAPLGLSNTVTEGIVSALHRSIQIASSAAPDSGDEEEAPEDGGQGEEGPFFFDFGQGRTPQQSASETIKIAVIQTDAAINPGNSGGALVNGAGELVGINVAIANAGSTSSTGGNIGVGFAIPSSVAERVAEELIADGAATHGLLGATVQPSTAVEDATITGAYISELTSGGAAEAAGLRAGDIVTEFNGAPVTGSIDLTAQVRAAAGGQTVELTYVRNGKTQTVEVTLGTL